MNRRQAEFAEARKEQEEREARIQAYVFARVLRGHTHDHAKKELQPYEKR